MKPVRNILILCLTILVGACAPVRVTFDYEPRPDWSGFKTFNYYPDMETGLNDLDSRRLLDALERVLREKGYSQSEDPDFLIDIATEIYEEPRRSNIGVGIGGGGRNVGGGVSVGIPVGSASLKRRITFNIIDTATRGLVWQAIASDSFREGADPIEKETRFMQIATKAFGGFPPGR